MDGVILTELKQIFHPQGDIYHGLKANEPTFQTFGEAYFTTIYPGDTKGWKMHKVMTMNLVVPVGKVHFYLYNSETNDSFSVELGIGNYQRLTVRPGLWMAFSGIDKENLILNIASIPHDPEEAVNVPLDTYPL